MLRHDALLPRATHTIRPILRSRELRMRYRSKRRKRKKKKKKKKKKICTSTSREYDPESTVPLAGMLSKFYGDFVFISVHGPVYGDAHKNFHSPSREYDLELTIPLAGMQSKYYIPASGDNFAEMHIKIYIPPSREYDPESTVPLAGMQSKFYIPASGDFVIIFVHRARERRCT